MRALDADETFFSRCLAEIDCSHQKYVTATFKNHKKAVLSSGRTGS
jgi:hypothetical protein